MVSLLVYLMSVFGALGVGALAALSDFRVLKIPNLYSFVISGLFVFAFSVHWLLGANYVFSPVLSHVISGGVVFVVTLGMFAVGGIGAGDSKLASAFALWVGVKGLTAFLFYMALFGGVLGILALVLKKWKPWKAAPAGGWFARVQAGENKVPYGIAIFLGALASFAKLGYFNVETFVLFVS